MFEKSVGTYTAYGIEIYDTEKDETIFMIHDVFYEKDRAEQSIRLLNHMQPEIIHFPAIVEDMLTDPDFFFADAHAQEEQL